MSARVQAIEKAIIALLDARGVDVGMEPDFTTQAKAIGGRAFLNRRSKSNLPERQGSRAGLWSAELNDKEISSALDQIEYGISRGNGRRDGGGRGPGVDSRDGSNHNGCRSRRDGEWGREKGGGGAN